MCGQPMRPRAMDGTAVAESCSVQLPPQLDDPKDPSPVTPPQTAARPACPSDLSPLPAQRTPAKALLLLPAAALECPHAPQKRAHAAVEDCREHRSCHVRLDFAEATPSHAPGGSDAKSTPLVKSCQHLGVSTCPDAPRKQRRQEPLSSSSASSKRRRLSWEHVTKEGESATTPARMCKPSCPPCPDAPRKDRFHSCRKEAAECKRQLGFPEARAARNLVF